MDTALRIIHETLIHRGFELVAPPAVYRGPVLVHGTAATVEIDIKDTTFAKLPAVRLIDATSLPIKEIAHLIGAGTVCYHDGRLVLDLYNPGGSVLRVLAETVTALERSFGGGATSEFERELASYWQGKIVFVAVPHSSVPEIVECEILNQSRNAGSGIVIVPKGAWKKHSSDVRVPATLLNLAADLQHAANFPPQDLSSAVAYLSDQSHMPAGWKPTVMRSASRGEYVFISAPNAIIGWTPDYPGSLKTLQKAKGIRPQFFSRAVAKSAPKIGLNRMTGKEVDLAFCVERNLAGEPSLARKRVVLIGCGTIGSYLARMLVQTGAGSGASLFLYDIDKLSPGNLGRHLLGFTDLAKHKATATAQHLRQFHPEVLVEARNRDAVSEWQEIEKADLVIDATGEPNVSTALNERYYTSARSGAELALMHTFVFGNGVAAQNLLNLKDGHVCYRCLKTDFDGQWRYNPLKDATSPLREAPARCGEGGYVPFSVDAPVTAATLAVRAALDWASGQPGTRLRTAIVDYKAGREKMPWVSPDSLKDCPACGK